jgi:hypothetical protein
MPDFERTLRSLAVHVTESEKLKADLINQHIGMDKARREIVVVALFVAALKIAYDAYKAGIFS